MGDVVKLYEDVFGMTEMLHFTDDDLDRVLRADVEGRHQRQRPREVPDQRARRGKRKSQIDEYLEFYGGAGAQHIAVATRHRQDRHREMRERGIQFLTVPETYYDDVPERIGEIEESLEDLRRLGILVDRDDEAYMQIFTKPVGDRPTMFFEVIERHGARGLERETGRCSRPSSESRS